MYLLFISKLIFIAVPVLASLFPAQPHPITHRAHIVSQQLILCFPEMYADDADDSEMRNSVQQCPKNKYIHSHQA